MFKWLKKRRERNAALDAEIRSRLQAELFPAGRPSPEEFIAVIAQRIREQQEERERSQGADLPVEISEAQRGNTTACP